MNQNIKKIIFSLTTLMMMLSFSVALAQAPGEKKDDLVGILERAAGESGAGYDVEGTSSSSLAVIVGEIIKTFLSLLGVVFMVYTIYAGYLWMTARGDEEKITKAKSIIRGSVIGLIIVFTSYAVTSFIVSQITAASGYKN